MPRQFTQDDVTGPMPIERQVELRERSQKGATAAYLMEFHEKEVLPEQERSIRRRIFALIDDPDKALDPDIAAQSWIELRAAYKLVERLRKVKTRGEAAGIALPRSPGESDSGQ